MRKTRAPNLSDPTINCHHPAILGRRSPIHFPIQAAAAEKRVSIFGINCGAVVSGQPKYFKPTKVLLLLYLL